MIKMTDIYDDIKTEYVGQIKTDKKILDLALSKGKTFAGRPAWIIYTVYGLAQVFTPPNVGEYFNVFGYSVEVLPLIENKLKNIYVPDPSHGHPLAGAFPTGAGIIAPLMKTTYLGYCGNTTTTTIGTGPYIATDGWFTIHE